MIRINNKKDSSKQEYVEEIGIILDKVRTLEYHFTEDNIMNEGMEDCLMQIKISFKIIREALYAIDNLNNFEKLNIIEKI